MPDCNRCCCFRSLTTAVAAIGVFTLVTSLMQLLVQTSVFTGIVENSDGEPINIFDKQNGSYSKEQIVYMLYIALAGGDLLVVLFSVVLLFGVEPAKPSRAYFMPWIIFFPVYILFESGLNIFYFYTSFSMRMKGPMDEFITRKYGFLIVPLVYWAVKEILILVGWVVVIIYTRQIVTKPSQDTLPLQGDYPSTTTNFQSPSVLRGPDRFNVSRAPTTFYQAGPAHHNGCADNSCRRQPGSGIYDRPPYAQRVVNYPNYPSRPYPATSPYKYDVMSPARY